MSMTIDMREAPAAVIDLRGLMSVFNRRKKLIAAVTAACVLLALVVALHDAAVCFADQDPD
jgi:uncharacterized protein involved in exopolysaccharide biosynthesis